MKNYLGECSSKVTRQNGERSEILVSNPGVFRKTQGREHGNGNLDDLKAFREN